MGAHWPVAILVMVTAIAGAAGGFANFLITRAHVEQNSGADRGIPEDHLSWLGYMFVGMVAAFTVPLFLNLTQSNLLVDWLKSPEGAAEINKLMVLTGFSLVAAFSSRAFMQGMSARVLAQMRQEIRESTQQIRESTQRVNEGIAQTKRAVEDTKQQVVSAKGELVEAKREAEIAKTEAGRAVETAQAAVDIFEQTPRRSGAFGAEELPVKPSELQDPLDRRILGVLADHGATAAELAESLDVPRSEVVRRLLASLQPLGMVSRHRMSNDVFRYEVAPGARREGVKVLETVG